MNSPRATRIMIAEDHPLFRKALLELIRSDPHLEIVGETGDGTQVLELVSGQRPDILLLDLGLPGMPGLEIVRRLRDSQVNVKVIALTMHKEDEIFNSVMDAGASGYVLKESAADAILEGIRTVLEGGFYISPSLAHILLERRKASRDAVDSHPGLAELTRAEIKILKLIAENRTSREIAALLSISEKTVENHRTNISSKLGLRGSNSLLKFAIERRSAIARL